jgi:hypothetical protein
MPATTTDVPIGMIAALLMPMVATDASQLADVMVRMFVGAFGAEIVNVLLVSTDVTM